MVHIVSIDMFILIPHEDPLAAVYSKWQTKKAVPHFFKPRPLGKSVHSTQSLRSARQWSRSGIMTKLWHHYMLYTLHSL